MSDVTVRSSGAEVEEALQALEVICASNTFRSAPRQRALLRFLAEESLAGRGGALGERSIAVGLGLGPDFDPRHDPTVRVLVSRLRARLARYYEGEGAGDRLRFSIPLGGYRATVGAAAVEEVDHRPVVAVATFASPAAAPADEAWTEGISESLAVALSQFHGARVLGPVTVDESLDHAQVARDLHRAHGADLVVLGTVRSVGSTVRITTWLIEGSTGITSWADQFDGDLDTSAPLAGEDRVVERLASVLADEFGLIPAAFRGVRTTGDAPGHRAMLDFYAYARTLDEGRQAAVIASLAEAVERAPGHAPYLGALASVLAFAGVGTVLAAQPDEAGLQRSEALARRALAIDSSEPYARLVMAYLRLVSGDAEEGQRQIRAMLDGRRVTPAIRSMCGVFLCISDAWDEGIAHLRASHDLNPSLPTWQHGFLGLDALVEGDAAGALDHARRVDTPGLVWGPLLRGAAHGALGESDAASAELARIGGFPSLAAQAEGLMRGHMRLPDPVIEAVLVALASVPDAAP